MTWFYYAPISIYVYCMYNVCADILPNPHPLHMQSNLYTNNRFIKYISDLISNISPKFADSCYANTIERENEEVKRKGCYTNTSSKNRMRRNVKRMYKTFFPFIIIIIAMILIIHFVAVLIFTILRMWIQNLILLLDFAWTLNLFTAIFHFKMYCFRYYNI